MAAINVAAVASMTSGAYMRAFDLTLADPAADDADVEVTHGITGGTPNFVEFVRTGTHTASDHAWVDNVGAKTVKFNRVKAANTCKSYRLYVGYIQPRGIVQG